MVNILWWVIIISKGQPENLEPSATTDEVEAGLLTVSSETRVDINSGEKLGEYFHSLIIYDHFPGQSERLEIAALADEKEQLLTVTSETRIDTNSGETTSKCFFL